MAAASATSLSAAFSSVSLNSLPRISSPSYSHRLRFPISKPPLTLLSGSPPKPSPPRADPSDIGFDSADPEEISDVSPPEPAKDYPRAPEFLEEPSESEEDIERAFEEIYGPAYNGVSHLGNDVYATVPKRKATLDLKIKKEKVRDGFEERVVQVRRVTKVVKGGKLMSFRAVVVVGDKQGKVGVGVAQAKEVVIAVEKAVVDARRHIISVPMTKYNTFPHRAEAYSGAAKVMLRPAAPGTGIIAGGSVKIVLEMVGIENALGKQLGSDNALNNARATIEAMEKMRSFSEVAEQRRIPMEQLWQ